MEFTLYLCLTFEVAQHGVVAGVDARQAGGRRRLRGRRAPRTHRATLRRVRAVATGGQRRGQCRYSIVSML